MVFQQEIVQWYSINKRDLPWRNTRDPYVIWLSEIILQQTRVAQGLPYFNSFLHHFPSVKHFAVATEEQVLKLWQGLGYYSRGRNMLYAAKQVMDLHKGVFPVSYTDLIQLKGVGAYTAAAISSLSSGEERAVVDGNVFRVLSRYFGIDTPIDSTAGKAAFAALAHTLLEQQNPAIYNQAIMEFGALICKPMAPLCADCPVKVGCVALAQGSITKLPVKSKKMIKKTRQFNYLLCVRNDQILMQSRGSGDIWQGLYDLPLIETPDKAAPEALMTHSNVVENFGTEASFVKLKSIKHLLTHQILMLQFFALENYNVNFIKQNNWSWVAISDLDTVPMPIVIHDFLVGYFKKINKN